MAIDQSTTHPHLWIPLSSCLLFHSQQYALHVHNWGDLTSSLGSKNISTAVDGVGSHFNPFNAPHGCDMPGTFQSKHVGDIGNYTSNKDTTFNTFKSTLADLSYTNRSIIGRSVILHQSYDHCTGPAGDAGTPISQQNIHTHARTTVKHCISSQKLRD